MLAKVVVLADYYECKEAVYVLDDFMNRQSGRRASQNIFSRFIYVAVDFLVFPAPCPIRGLNI